ncbi:hypothetical protein LTR56_025142 [Elasticomyces elasticus]|nr:hypothetical protein LTR56_025142 [Elasticomyces elasticus]KAK3621301.1 hypothetical protein LTR22_025236 [Elasticomyces elasticus]KAK4904873.1 hypothetical protein LTR49_025764 [Elasticomyces elasticus]KAK5741027.1 hypothetical protein LTS12_024747 [Elasticomyces elasticus]
MSSALKPPRIQTQDPGAHELSGSEDEHFSSASEGDNNDHNTPHHHPHQNPNRLSTPATPITRVERVDSTPAYGEVPGTHAYSIRTADAVPDEVEIVPEGARSRSGTRSRAMSNLSEMSGRGSPRPSTPGGTVIPKTVVERVDDKPAFGEVEGTLAKELRAADAEPDEVLRGPEVARDGTIDQGRYDERVVVEDDDLDPEQQQAWLRSTWDSKQQGVDVQPEEDIVEQDDGNGDGDNDGFGDDFDDFNEGDGEEDFGDFDEAGEAEPEAGTAIALVEEASSPDILAGLPPLNISSLSSRATKSAIQPYVSALFPSTLPLPPLRDLPPIDPSKTSPFLSDRSLALWQQLVSPPPMQPPNWTRSRIRRLFLVSLGVPVDLDEILPPSKQKRLVLPNINLLASPRPSTAVERLREGEGNDSTTSLDSRTGAAKLKPSRRAGKGVPGPPEFDLNGAALLCRVTPEAMGGMEDEELRAFLGKLGRVVGEASGVLEYWVQRKDEGVREKEALEGVVGNLVGWVKGRRGK